MPQSNLPHDGAAPMQAADKTASMRAAAILRAHGYRQGACHELNGSRLDFYSGPKGNVIVQVWQEPNGVTMYADWPLGATWQETEAALTRRAHQFTPAENAALDAMEAGIPTPAQTTKHRLQTLATITETILTWENDLPIPVRQKIRMAKEIIGEEIAQTAPGPQLDIHGALANAACIMREVGQDSTGTIMEIDDITKAATALAIREADPEFIWENQKLSWEEACFRLAQRVPGNNFGTLEEWVPVVDLILKGGAQ